ncbi:MAG: alanine--tRNA ligase [Gammaproteobacteria bacterium]
MMKSADIRQAFLNYFREKNHEVVPSSQLIPGNDPTLLFTNAGMVQFKEVFLGLEKKPYTKATSSQRCVRAGGKHNDLENVGYTARHHTFFEMLGNFSFGDYFKREAIHFAWDFLTTVLNIPAEKLWVTVFEEDDETADIWLKEMKIDPTRFSRCGEKDNFWAMGDTGPCGPCTEIFYDHGPEVAGGPPGSPDADGDRYIEIWNLVFMQYNRDANGKIKPLPKPSVDTGMGLERISAVMQGVHNNYDIDLFQNLIDEIKLIIKNTPTSEKNNSNEKIRVAPFESLKHKSDSKKLDTQPPITSLQVIADHIRSVSFLITDGVTPSNEGRGYVLRRIMRRALRHGHKLGLRDPFFYKLVKPLVKEMGDAYPELTKAQSLIEKIILREEELFATTLDQGLKIFETEVAKLKNKVIPGDIIFRLYDTYGFPLDLTADIARERNFSIDEEGFHHEMELQRQRSQAASKFDVAYEVNAELDHETTFIGYKTLTEKTNILALLSGDQNVNQLEAGQEGIIVLSHTPFYAESGGQVGDQGKISSDHALFEVQDTQKQGTTILHFGKVKKGTLSLGTEVTAKVSAQTRSETAANHSATHLLHAALRQLFGEHILQKGSLVEPKRFRLDFSHFEPLTFEQIRAVEHLVNEQIRKNLVVETKIMTPEEAMDSGAMALFGEKYGAEVRVLCMGDFSIELCGGTHVKRTGAIGLFKIISETGIASGIRRMEAVTGESALNFCDAHEDQLHEASALMKSNITNIIPRIKQVLSHQKTLEQDLNQLRLRIANLQTHEFAEKAQTIGDIQALSLLLKDVDQNIVKEILGNLQQKLKKSVILIAFAGDENKVNLIAGVTPNLIPQFSANELIKFLAEQLHGKGGGRPELAQGAAKQHPEINQILQSVYTWIQNKLT